MTHLSDFPSPAARIDPGVQYTGRMLDRVLARIVPFLAGDAALDDAESRTAAWQLLACFDAVTGKELQLAGQVVALSLASLDCLRCCMSEPDLPLPALLRMQDHALALNGLSEKSRRTLEARKRARLKGQAARPESGMMNDTEFDEMIARAREMVSFARMKLEAHQVEKALAAAPLPETDAAPVSLPAVPARQSIEAMAVPSAGLLGLRSPGLRGPGLRGQAERNALTADHPGRRKSALKAWEDDLKTMAASKGITRH